MRGHGGSAGIVVYRDSFRAHPRPKGILRKDTNVSDVSDGTGQIHLPALFGPGEDGAWRACKFKDYGLWG